MAGQLDENGLLLKAPTGSTINNGIVTNNPNATGLPSGWDAQTYANFKQANPSLEPNAEDTARMLNAGVSNVPGVPVLPQPNTRSLISQTAQPGYIQGYDTQQGYAPVFVPKGQYVPGISATPNKMTTDSLQSSSGIKLPPVEQPLSQADATIAGGKASIDSIMQEFTPQVSETQQKAQGVNDLIASLTKDLENKGVDQLSTEQSAGIPELKTQFAEINSLMSTRLAEYNALLTQNKNKPITMSSIIGNERAILDAKASDIGLLQAQAEGLKGRIQVAQDTANRAVDLKYSTIEARLNTYEAQLRALEPTLNKEEKQQALAQQVLLDQKKQEVADKKEKEKAIQGAMMDYFNAGGTDTKVANAISSAKTVEEAQRLAGMQVAKTVQEDRLLDTQYKRAQIANIQSEINNRGASAQGYDPTEILAYAQQFASNGKIPTGLPKGSFGLVSQIAKELPKPEGTLVNRNTGVAAELSASEQEGLVALYDIQKRLPGLRADFDKMIPGLVSGTIGNLFPSKTKQNYLTQRDEILSLLLKARSGAAVSEQEFERYKKLLPSTFNKALFLGGSGVNKIDNFQKSINSSLTSRLDTTGNAIYGYSEVKIGDQSYKVGDIINNGEQSARVNPDGTLTIIQ